MTRKKPCKNTKPTRRAPAKKTRGPRAVAQLSLDFVKDRAKSIQERLPVAVLMLANEPQAARDALEAMLEDPSLTSKQESRIVRALARAEGKTPKAERPQAPEPIPNLSGPCTIAIASNPDLYELWLKIHRDDPDQVWERRLADVPRPLLHLVPLADRDALRALPVSERACELDRLLSKALLR